MKLFDETTPSLTSEFGHGGEILRLRWDSRDRLAVPWCVWDSSKEGVIDKI